MPVVPCYKLRTLETKEKVMATMIVTRADIIKAVYKVVNDIYDEVEVNPNPPPEQVRYKGGDVWQAAREYFGWEIMNGTPIEHLQKNYYWKCMENERDQTCLANRTSRRGQNTSKTNGCSRKPVERIRNNSNARKPDVPMMLQGLIARVKT